MKMQPSLNHFIYSKLLMLDLLQVFNFPKFNNYANVWLEER
jgi:hypothetical protein